jgi:hypothetical protein
VTSKTTAIAVPRAAVLLGMNVPSCRVWRKPRRCFPFLPSAHR